MRKVIFLDIDGVLQPDNSTQRFKNDLEKLREELAVKYQNDDYRSMDRYDLGAIYYDWDKKAVERLRKLCDETGAEIVISSDWRRYSPLPRLKAYFKLHELDTYITGEIPQLERKSRHQEIADYLEHHQDIERFVILDDGYRYEFEAAYPEVFVYCRYIFDDECYEKALGILTKK